MTDETKDAPPAPPLRPGFTRCPTCGRAQPEAFVRCIDCGNATRSELERKVETR